MREAMFDGAEEPPTRTDSTLALVTIIRRCEVQSSAEDFPIEMPFTSVAARPIPAHVCSGTQGQRAQASAQL